MVYDCIQILITDFKAVGVEFAKNGGFQYTVSANKEVILSAGAINSPHLLMLSGIGPKEELENHHVGIHVMLCSLGGGKYLRMDILVFAHA